MTQLQQIQEIAALQARYLDKRKNGSYDAAKSELRQLSENPDV